MTWYDWKWALFDNGQEKERGWLKAPNLHLAKHLCQQDTRVEFGLDRWTDREKISILPISKSKYLTLEKGII